MNEDNRHIYEFGAFRLDPTARLLLREGKPVALTPKVFDTLLLLVQHHGQLLEKDHLMKELWADSFVEEGNLTYNISTLRKALGEKAGKHQYILTISGHGYRFAAEVKEVVEKPDVPASSEVPALMQRRVKRKVALAAALVVVVSGSLIYWVARKALSATELSSTSPIKSIAVLPFMWLDAEQNGSEMEYLSDGISESLINRLSQLSGMKVIARSSSFKYKGKDVDPQEVAQALGVEAIVTGKVLHRGEQLQISIELMDARDKTQIWGEQYNRKSIDLLALQAEISQEIAQKLRLKLSGAEQQQLAKRPTESLSAFQYYILGRSYTQRGTREGVLAAIRYCEKAIEEDRNYALAYAGLADAYGNLGVRGYIAPIEGRRKAEETALKALALDENLAEAHAALGYSYTVFAPSNFSLGDRELRYAIELSPSLAVAHRHLGVSLARQGRLDEGLEEILKAHELDPLSSIIARLVAVLYYLKRDYVRALELIRQANELGPAFSVHFEIGMYIHNKLFNEALAGLEKAKRERKNDPILIYSTGMVYAAQGKRAEALKIVKELEEMSGASLDEAHWIAKIYAALNEKERAFSWLEHGLATGAIGAFYKDEPIWDTIRSDPRFTDLLRRMEVY